MSFLPLKLDQLQVGLYIKLHYGWGGHPFLRNTFKIQSHKDIAIIRRNQLTKITYDPTRSDPQAVEQLTSPQQSETPESPKEATIISEEELNNAEQALREEKEALHEKLFSNQSQLQETKKAYQATLNQNRTVLQMIRKGESESLNLAQEVVRSMTTILDCPSPTLTLVNAPPPQNLVEEISVDSMTVCSLSLIFGATLGLTQEEMEVLGQGAMLHNIGCHRIPSEVRRKKPETLSKSERQLFETYPYYSRQMAEEIPGVSMDCLNILSQHRENLDGSGYPQGLKDDQISFLPRVVRVVTEYYSLLKTGIEGVRYTPTQALTHLYTQMKGQCQPDLIDSFIATVTVYPPGSFVRLSDDSVGVVIRTNQAKRLNPFLVLYEMNSESEDLVIVDLASDSSLIIQEGLNPMELPPKALAQLQQSLGGVSGVFVSA